MKYSVIIPCYKCEATLKKTVASIQACGLTDFEIILVDDGSPDGTPALCDRLAAEHGNVRCFHQPNGGVSSARNYGLREAKGGYVWFFDSDDLVDPDSMKRAAQIIDEHAPDMLIFGMSFDYYHKSRMYQRLELYYDVEGEMTPAEVDAAFDELYRNNSLTSSCNKLYRRSVLTENHICYDSNLFIMEDFLLVLQALQHCQTVYNLPQVIYRYIHLGGAVDHAAARLSRVSDLAAYLKPFEAPLKKHPDVLSGLFFMLLRQKIGIQTEQELVKTARLVCASEYAVGKYAPFCSKGNQALIERLRRGEYHEFVEDRKKRQTRNKVVGAIKKTQAYTLLKGSKPRRVKW